MLKVVIEVMVRFSCLEKKVLKIVMKTFWKLGKSGCFKCFKSSREFAKFEKKNRKFERFGILSLVWRKVVFYIFGGIPKIIKNNFRDLKNIKVLYNFKIAVTIEWSWKCEEIEIS
jgi:hypothetical protein